MNQLQSLLGRDLSVVLNIGKQHMQDRLAPARDRGAAVPGRLAAVPAEPGHATRRRGLATNTAGPSSRASSVRANSTPKSPRPPARPGIEIRHDLMDAHPRTRWTPIA